jgi:hypothetical protein
MNKDASTLFEIAWSYGVELLIIEQIFNENEIKLKSKILLEFGSIRDVVGKALTNRF